MYIESMLVTVWGFVFDGFEAVHNDASEQLFCISIFGLICSKLIIEMLVIADV